jgi:hypothetical protein
MFALKSCKGFSPYTYHVTCCAKHSCDVHYTEQAVQDLGFSLPYAMEFLTCHELQPSTANSRGQASSGSRRTKLLVLLLASGLAAAATLVLVLLWWQLNAFQGRSMRKEEFHKEKSIQELEIQPKSGQNGKAVVVCSHGRRQMDLQAQLDSSNTVSDSNLNGEDVPDKLMVRAIQISRRFISILQIAMQARVTTNESW